MWETWVSLQGTGNPRAGLSVCLQRNIWSPSTDTCGTGTQQAARGWGLEQSSGGERQKETEKNQRIWHLNATKGFEERGLGTLLWAVGGAERISKGTSFHVDQNKLLQSLEFPQGLYCSAGAEG